MQIKWLHNIIANVLITKENSKVLYIVYYRDFSRIKILSEQINGAENGIARLEMIIKYKAILNYNASKSNMIAIRL